MLCQHCNKNEADKVFISQWMGRQFEWHICDECMTRIWQKYEAAGQAEVFQAMSGWWPGKENTREDGRQPFPGDAPAEMKKRLRLNALRHRLEEAAERENYEEAARLRDSIAKLEQGELSYEF